MSSTRSIRIPLPSSSNADVFCFGKSSLYVYNSSNSSLVVYSLIHINTFNSLSNVRLQLSPTPTWTIRRLILNEDETILALLGDKTAYVVHLPKLNIDVNVHSLSKESYQCLVSRVPPSSKASVYSLIDFAWLNSSHFVIVYTHPSSSQCHLYTVQSLQQCDIKYLQTFSVGLSSTNKLGTSNRKISLYQPADIVKLDVMKRKEQNLALILLFALKNNGDFFILEIDESQLSENEISEEFQGPICILPSTFDNYGSDHNQSTFICLSNPTRPLVVFTRDRHQINQCILLSPSLNEYCLFDIDIISLPENQNQQLITLIIRDRFSFNRYYISDLAANVYRVEVSWIDQVQQGIKQLPLTRIEHLVNETNLDYKIKKRIVQMNSIQTNNNKQYLAIIVQSQTDQQKELIFVYLQSSEPIENSLPLSKFEKPESSSGFIDHIRSLLSREQSIPHVTLSTLSINVSDPNLKKNLSRFIKILTEEYIEKQERIRCELKGKQRYLLDLEQRQSDENQQQDRKFRVIQQQFQILRDQYQEEYSRRERLSAHVDDLLSIIEQNTPVLSNAEIRIQQQLRTYQTQLNHLNEDIRRTQQYILSNPDHQLFNTLSMKNIQNLIQHHQNQIEQIKNRLQINK